MIFNKPASRSNEHVAISGHGLTPRQIMYWIREEGFRAKADLEGNMLQIVTGLAGYDVSVWCPRTSNLDDRCEDLLFDMKLKLSDKVPTEVLRRYVSSFNLNGSPATVAVLEPSGVIAIRMSFMIEHTSSSLLFARYFFAFDNILQSFRSSISVILQVHAGVTRERSIARSA